MALAIGDEDRIQKAFEDAVDAGLTVESPCLVESQKFLSSVHHAPAYRRPSGGKISSNGARTVGIRRYAAAEGRLADALKSRDREHLHDALGAAMRAGVQKDHTLLLAARKMYQGREAAERELESAAASESPHGSADASIECLGRRCGESIEYPRRRRGPAPRTSAAAPRRIDPTSVAAAPPIEPSSCRRVPPVTHPRRRNAGRRPRK